jgi:glycosyltransferase involved in cell wall biosynthesis
MRKLTKSLVLIVWNEIEGCKADVPLLPRRDFDEIFAIDGGSSDGTVEYLQEQGIPVHRQCKKSLNAAYAEAVAISRCEAVVVFFPKATIDPTIINGLCHQLDVGFDLVIASRNLPGAHNEEDEKFFKVRKWGVSALGHAASLIWRREGWRIRDVLHGVKGFTVDAYRRMLLSDTGVTVDLEMTVRAYRLRIPRTELAVCEQKRLLGQTRFEIWPTGKRLACFLCAELLRRLGSPSVIPVHKQHPEQNPSAATPLAQQDRMRLAQKVEYSPNDCKSCPIVEAESQAHRLRP